MSRARFRILAITCLLVALWGPFAAVAQDHDEVADLILINGRVYSLNWDEPAPDGTPAANAPCVDGQWHPDAEAVAIRGGSIVFVGTSAEALRFAADDRTRVIDVDGATILPGFVDAHTHVAGMGQLMTQLDLRGVETPAEVLELTVAWAKKIPKGEWVIGKGWDEGDWATKGYPDWDELNERLPDHPVALNGLHGFATWANDKAFEAAGIETGTPDPVGGEIRRHEDGTLTGILVNNATDLMNAAVPAPTLQQQKQFNLAGLEEMARSGYVAVHEAGVYEGTMAAWEELAQEGVLPIRMYGMLAATDAAVVKDWLERGPYVADNHMFMMRCVKAYYDGSLGARGARLLADYTDQPGHRGVSGNNYGFDQSVAEALMAKGFQIAIHAIGDAGNRETLDFIEAVLTRRPEARSLRHRIEHAQIIHPDDFDRLAAMNLVASMQPPHAVEDMTWARFRLGRNRLVGAYAWRTLRMHGAALAFGSDLTGSDHSIFYGLHAAITRRNKERWPEDGWRTEERMTVEEAIRGYTNWPAYASFLEDKTGVLAPGRWSDITVIDIDPFTLAAADPGGILDGEVLLTIANGRIVHKAE